jgi:hypothetical protein
MLVPALDLVSLLATGVAVMTDVEIECASRVFCEFSLSPVWLARERNVNTGAASISTSTITAAIYLPDALRIAVSANHSKAASTAPCHRK